MVDRLLLALGNVVTYNNAFVFLWQEERLLYASSRDFYDRPVRLTSEQAEEIWHESPLIQEIKNENEVIRINDVRGR